MGMHAPAAAHRVYHVDQLAPCLLPGAQNTRPAQNMACTGGFPASRRGACSGRADARQPALGRGSGRQVVPATSRASYRRTRSARHLSPSSGTGPESSGGSCSLGFWRAMAGDQPDLGAATCGWLRHGACSPRAQCRMAMIASRGQAQAGIRLAGPATGTGPRSECASRGEVRQVGRAMPGAMWEQRCEFAIRFKLGCWVVRVINALTTRPLGQLCWFRTL